MKALMLAVTILVFSLLLSACGGGGGGATPPTKPGTISLRWDTPSTKVDGSALSLSEIGGYKIYLTQDNTVSPTKAYVDIKDSSTNHYVVSGLAAGKYYLYVTTYDVNGDESPMSDPVSTTI